MGDHSAHGAVVALDVHLECAPLELGHEGGLGVSVTDTETDQVQAGRIRGLVWTRG